MQEPILAPPSSLLSGTATCNLTLYVANYVPPELLSDSNRDIFSVKGEAIHIAWNIHQFIIPQLLSLRV